MHGSYILLGYRLHLGSRSCVSLASLHASGFLSLLSAHRNLPQNIFADLPCCRSLSYNRGEGAAFSVRLSPWDDANNNTPLKDGRRLSLGGDDASNLSHFRVISPLDQPPLNARASCLSEKECVASRCIPFGQPAAFRGLACKSFQGLHTFLKLLALVLDWVHV